MPARTPLYLVDASIYIFRAYFSLPESITGATGRPVNAVYGFADFLARLVGETRASHIALAFDESLTTSFRNEIYPPYKANRALPPDDLAAQLHDCRALAGALGLACFRSDRYEADDLIGTLARKLRPKNFRMVFVSSDKDLAQLMRPGDRLWNFARDNLLKHGDIQRHYGVKPGQIIDLLALAGDSSDNIPGVPGIGPKSAAALLRHYGSLDRLYSRLHTLPATGLRGARRLQRLLTAHREQAELSRRLATIADNAPIRSPVAGVARKRPRRSELTRLYERLNFGAGIQRRLEIFTHRRTQ